MSKWVLSFLLFVGHWTLGQEVRIYSNTETPIHLSEGFELHIPANENKYIVTNWSKGQLYYPNGGYKSYDSLNFDRYTNAIEVVKNNKPLTIMPMGLLGALIFDTSASGYLLIVGSFESNNQFLLINSIGKYVLASKIDASIKNSELSSNIDEVRFVPKPEEELNLKPQYFIWKNLTWEPFKISKKAVLKLFGKDKKDFLKLVSRYDIDLSRKESLIQVFKIINEN